MSKRIKIVIALFSVMMLFGFMSLYAVKIYRPRQFRYGVNYLKSYIYTTTPLGKRYHTNIKRDRYSLHLLSAKKQGIQLISFDKEVLSNPNLLKVKNGSGFRIYKLNYSKPYLSNRAEKVLKQIGEEFSKKTEGEYFTVTSLTRSNESQKKLRKVNGNASRGISSHSYGTSFDISYIRFNGKKRMNHKLQKTLENILISFQKEGKIYLIYEIQNMCYHVTVR